MFYCFVGQAICDRAVMGSNEEVPVFRAAKLTSENYHHWKFNIKMMLIGRDLWEIVEGSEVLPEEATNKQTQEFRKRVNKALSLICLAVSDNLQIYVRNAKSGKEAWDSLQNHFEEKTLSRKVGLHQKLYSARMEGTMIDHVNNIRTIADQLEALDDVIEEKYLVMILLSSLPQEYNNLLTTLETLKEDNLTWDYVRDRVLTEYDRRKASEKQAPRTAQDALFAGGDAGKRAGGGFTSGGAGSGGNGRNKIRCHFCNEIGHIQRDCEKKKAHLNAKTEKEKQETAAASFCLSKQENKFEFGDFCPEFALHVQVEPLGHAPVVNDKPKDSKWFLDSACSNHMTGVQRDLANLKYFSDDQPRYVTLADKSVVRAAGSGNLNVYLRDNNGKSVPVTFKDVMFVPKLEKRLISIGQLAKRGAQITFNRDSVKMRIAGKNFMFGHSYGNLYSMNCGVVASAFRASNFNNSDGCSTSVGENSSFEGVNDGTKLDYAAICATSVHNNAPALNGDDDNSCVCRWC